MIELAGLQVLGQRLGRDALFQRGIGPQDDPQLFVGDALELCLDVAGRLFPSDGDEPALFADQRRFDPIFRIDVLMPETRSVVDPALVHFGVALSAALMRSMRPVRASTMMALPDASSSPVVRV